MKKLLGIFKRLPKTISNFFLKVFYPDLSNPLDFFELKETLANNKKFKDLYKNKRCFIVGNGPSLNKQNLLHIKDEYLFVVNSFPHTELYDVLKPQFFVTWDAIQFDWGNPEYGENRINLFKKIGEYNPDTICILPVREKRKIESKNILNNKNILYSYWGAKWKKYKKTGFNFESQIPECNNVVDIAIMAAIYLGFSEIYLLGVDMTDFFKMYEYSWEGKVDPKYEHFYEHSKEEDKIFKEVMFPESTNEARLRVAADKLMFFRYINDIAIKKNVKIVNMTEGGGLDVFPREKYSDWIKKNKRL